MPSPPQTYFDIIHLMRWTVISLFLLLAASGCRTPPRGNDLSAPAEWRELSSEPVVVATPSNALTIVTDASPNNRWAARFLADTIHEMTGRRPPLCVERKGQKGKWPHGGLFIGDVSPNAGWTCPLTSDSADAFRVVAGGDCVRFLGRADFAVFDWCERELGLRFYGEDGKCVERRAEILVRSADYSDRPVFDCRQLSWQAPSPWLRVNKYGSTHRGGVAVHQPARWFKDEKVRAEAPTDIFETGTTPMLCYGNPATLAYYKRRIDRHIAGLEDSGGIVNTNRKVVTVCQWDAPVRCSCRWCRDAYDETAGFGGAASPIIWGRFTRQLATWLRTAHPDYMISFLPYLNTCQVPKSLLDRPLSWGARTTWRWPAERQEPRRPAGYGCPVPTLANAEAELCTMPGVALLKDSACKEHEERLIRQWRRVTGNKVLNWHYSCWPRDWTSAPYVYGQTVQRHYADMRDHVSGSFVCGSPKDVSQTLSHYVWMRCLWNPDVDVEALYDEYARRMFGAGAAPMRELIRMQETCWNRQWDGLECTYHNIFEVSFPRKDAVKMRELLIEAHRLATDAKDDASVRRIVNYASGLNTFMLESDALAARTTGGRLTVPSIRLNTTNAFVSAHSVRYPTPWAKTFLSTSVDKDTLVLTVRCEDPAAPKMNFTDVPVDDYVWGNDRLDISLCGRDLVPLNFRVDLLGYVMNDWEGRCTAKIAPDDAGWTATVRIRLSDADLKAGKVRGNVSRWRVGDSKEPRQSRLPGSNYERTRLNTVFTQPDNDPAAFVDFLLK